MKAEISRSLLDRIAARAAVSPDAEVCGLLLGSRIGDRFFIVDAPAAANVAPHPQTGFEIDPAMLIAAHRAERAGGPTLLGHYHSHPYGPAAPSPRDAAAAEPGRLWLILGEGAARLWLARSAGDFTAVSLMVA
jgi:proteasome lid subunit RPN8/RPN11